VPAALAAVVARLLAKDPADRYQRRRRSPARWCRSSRPRPNRPRHSPRAGAPGNPAAGTPAATPRRPAPPKLAAVKRPPGGGRKVRLWVAGAAAAAFALFLALWQGGALRVRTPEGVIVLENLPPGADVFVDGSRVTVKLPRAAGRWRSG